MGVQRSNDARGSVASSAIQALGINMYVGNNAIENPGRTDSTSNSLLHISHLLSSQILVL